MIPKFRVWDELGERMVYDVGFTPDGIAYTIPKNAEDSDQFDYYPECPVMQDTGLKDKNGKEIYEGDVVKGYWWENGERHRHIGKVVYGSASFKAVGVKQYKGMADELNSVYEVIGNIHENPELLI